MSISFAVSNVKPVELEEWEEAHPIQEVLPFLLGKSLHVGYGDLSGPNPKIEAFGGPSMISNNANGPKQGLFDAIYLAYDNHLPLTLSPDHVWLTIAQGFARHVSQNAKELYPQLILGATGNEIQKQIMVVRRDQFKLGDPSNDWAGVFEEFSQQIREKTVPKTYERLICDFSTTGTLERAVGDLTLMDTMQNYFSYEVHTCCGIPNITLTGTPADWKNVRAKASMLAEYGMGWWTEVLLPFLDRFVAASEGKVEVSWWEELFKRVGGSGGDTICGHINALFPFLKQTDYDYETKISTKVYAARSTLPTKNGFTGKPVNPWSEMQATEVPTGFVTVPFIWNYFNTKYPMQFFGGLVGVVFENEGVCPAPIWAVCPSKG